MRHRLVISTLAAAIAVAALADPALASVTTTQLPGQGQIVSGAVAAVVNPAAGTMNVSVGGPAVINWGQGAGAGAINPAGVAGFNIGSAARVRFTGGPGAAVLNIDSSGNASRLLGTLTAQGTDVFVANGNGIIVGAQARIASDHTVGLIANRLDRNAADRFDGRSSVAYDGHGGDVVVRSGASFSGGGEVLIAGGGNVNVDLSAFAGGVRLSAGRASSTAAAGDSGNARATLTTSGVQGGNVDGFSTAGTATNNGTLNLSHAHLTGTFTNNDILNLADGFAVSAALVNHGKVHARGDITLGSLVNTGWLTARGQLDVLRQVSNRGTLYSPDYKGAISAHGQFLNQGRIDGLSSVGTTGGDLINEGTIRLVDSQNLMGDAGTAWVIGGNLLNRGRIDGPTSEGIAVVVTNGNIDNTRTGVMADSPHLETGSDTELAGFASGADYSIRNEGTIIGDPSIYANFYSRHNDNDSTGSFVNTGVLNIPRSDSDRRSLDITAYSDVFLGGTVEIDGQPLNSSNTLNEFFLVARNGTLTIGTPLYFSTPQNGGASYLMAEKVRVKADVIGYGSNSDLYISTHRNDDGTYALSVDPGVQLSANQVNMDALP